MLSSIWKILEWEKSGKLVPFPAMLVVITAEEKKKLNSYAGFVLEQAKRAERKEKKSEKERELVDGNPFFSQILPYFPLLLETTLIPVKYLGINLQSYLPKIIYASLFLIAFKN